MSKQEMMKMQTCVLKVNIQCHCDGCKTKIKKLLQKVEGVYNTQINAEQGKVTVTGNVDPVKLIKKLEKSGKHAELWGPSKGSNNFQNALNNQFKNMQLSHGGSGKDNKAQKGGKGGQQQQMQQFKGTKDVKLPQKDQKSVKFSMQDDYIDASDDEFDDEFDDDEFDDDDFDEDDEEFGHSNGHGKGQFGGQRIMPNKMMPMGMMGQFDGPAKGGGGGGKPKKGGGGGDFEIPVVMKGKNGQKGGDGKGKNGKNGKSKGGNEKKEGKGKDKDKEKGKDGKSGVKTGIGAFLSFGRKSKNGREKDEEYTFGSTKGGNNNNGHGGKKGSSGKNERFDLHKPKQMYPEISLKGGGGGGQMGRQMPPQMGGGYGGQMPPQMGGGYGGMGGFPAVQGLPMNGPYQGIMGPGPYSQQQQQYMAMMMSQQGQNGNNMYHPAMYGRNPAAMNYMGNYMGPPPMARHPVADPYTHMFSDENAESCSVM